VRADIQELLRLGGGIIRRRDQPPALQQQLDRLRSAGELISLLPGYLTTPEGADTWSVRLRAGSWWAGPNAVLTRHAAARLTFWPECRIDTVSFTVLNPPRPQPGWPVVNSTVPPELTWLRSGLSVTNPGYTAVELANEQDGPAIVDRALRTRQATLDGMWLAASSLSGRRGNGRRLEVLRDSRDSPWSELERLGHRLLRQRRITGWRTNIWVDTRGGGCFVDVLFKQAKLVVEFDGWEFHGDREAFENDRRRRNELVLAGYVVLNFTWRQLTEDPDWVIGCIRAALIRTCLPIRNQAR
jgi:very-short-patch-repair endonuclease